MSSSGITGASSLSSSTQIVQTRSTQQSGRVDSDGDRDSGGRSGGVRGGHGGGLLAALGKALDQVFSASGGSTAGTSETSPSTSASDAKDAFQALAQDLFAALHVQGGPRGPGGPGGPGGPHGAPPPKRDNDGDDDGTGATSGVAQTGYDQAGAGGIQDKLQALIAALTASDSSSADGTTTDTASTDTTTSGATTTKLTQDFKTLLNALGAGDSKATLSDFLQTVSEGFAGASTTGNFISTRA